MDDDAEALKEEISDLRAYSGMIESHAKQLHTALQHEAIWLRNLMEAKAVPPALLDVGIPHRLMCIEKALRDTEWPSRVVTREILHTPCDAVKRMSER